MSQASLNPSGLQPRLQDRQLFDRLLRDFVPDDPFDFHAHLYRVHDLPSESEPISGDDEVGLSYYRRQMAAWMGDRAPKDGLFFAIPARDADVAGGNEFCLAETSRTGRSRVLAVPKPFVCWRMPKNVKSEVLAHRRRESELKASRPRKHLRRVCHEGRLMTRLTTS